MTDPDILSDMIDRTERAYRLPEGAVFGDGRSALETAARFEVIHDAYHAGYSRAFLAQFFQRDKSTITHAIQRHAASSPVPVFKSRRAA